QLPSPSERTHEYQSSVASPPPPGRSFRVALAEPHHYPSDVQQLLQKRLRIIGLVIASIFGVFTILNTVTALKDIERFLNTTWWLFTVNFVIFLTCSVATTVLWARRALPLSRLRALEAVLFLPVILDCGVFLASRLVGDGLIVHIGERETALF